MMIWRTIPVILKRRATVGRVDLDLLVCRMNFLVESAKKMPIKPRKNPIIGNNIDNTPTKTATNAFSFVSELIFIRLNLVYLVFFIYSLYILYLFKTLY